MVASIACDYLPPVPVRLLPRAACAEFHRRLDHPGSVVEWPGSKGYRTGNSLQPDTVVSRDHDNVRVQFLL